MGKRRIILKPFKRPQVKYMVTSGFLGAGKTTAMIAFAKSIDRRYSKAAVLANDLGASNIVDADLTETTGLLTTSITGNCICYQHKNLVDKLRQLADRGAKVIFSDIPGCGIGALDHVYLELNSQEPGEFDLMPFTCIVDPERLRMIMPEQADINLPPEMSFLLYAQMLEADLIVLNKIDTLNKDALEERLVFLRSIFPETPVMAMSAKTHEGVDDVVDYIMSHSAAAHHKDIGYGSVPFIEAENKLSWYNRRIFFWHKEDRNTDFNTVITDIFEHIRESLRKNCENVPHLKAFAAGNESDFFKASLTGIDYPIEIESTLTGAYSAISVIINARAAAPAQSMSDYVEAAVEAVCDKYSLGQRTFFIESFGMMEEGKGNGGRASRYE